MTKDKPNTDGKIILSVSEGADPKSLVVLFRPIFEKSEHWGFLLADIIEHIAKMREATVGEEAEAVREAILSVITDRRVQEVSAAEATMVGIAGSGRVVALGRAVEE